jgi:hypothetical protein
MGFLTAADKSFDFGMWTVVKLRWLVWLQVICLGVTNLLQKRETKKLQKEQESKKEGGENRKVIAGSGPRGFEQKIDEDDETDD